MPATPINDLMAEASCYACYSPGSVPELAELALLSRISGGALAGPVAAFTLTTLQNISTVSTNFITASYTPSANALLLAFVWSQQNVTINSVTGNGLTWVLVNSVEDVTANLKLWCYRAMSASPTAGALTVTTSSGSNKGVIIHIQQYTNVDKGGTNGSGALIQCMVTSGNSITVAPFNTNALNATVGIGAPSSTLDAVLESGWTQDLSVSQSPVFTLQAFAAHRLLTTDNSFTSGMVSGTRLTMQLEIKSIFSSDFITQPSDIPNLEIWARSDSGVYQDAAKTIPCTANGDLVYTWDNMGNTAMVTDFVQATVGLRPIYNVTGGANSKPRISFNSSMMRLAGGTINQPFTVFIVGKYTSNVGGFAAWLWSESSNIQITTLTASADSMYIAYGGGNVQGNVLMNNQPGLIAAVFNSGSSNLLVNGKTAVSTIPAGASSLDISATIGGF